MPVLFDENRIRDSSGENEAPLMDVVLRNCSIVYCFGWRAAWAPGGAEPAPADRDAATTTAPAMTTLMTASFLLIVLTCPLPL